MTYKRIIVAIDGSKTSDTAFMEAINLTSFLQAKLCIVHVVDTFPIVSLSMGADFDRCREIVKNDGQAILDRIKLLAQINNVTAETRLIEILDASKKVSERIIDVAQTWNADLIVIGTHGRRGFRRLMLGSVAEETIRMATVPVLLIRSPKDGEKQKKPLPYKRIMAAIDGSHLSHLVLTTAVNLTKAFNASLTVVHIANEFSGKDFIFAKQLLNYSETINKIGVEVLENAKRFSLEHNMPFDTMLVEITDPSGTVADKINEVAAAHQSDLIIIGTHGRSGVNRFLLGSVAEETVRSSTVPVLLVRAKENYVNPQKTEDRL